jgi:putative flippase GtrA
MFSKINSTNIKSFIAAIADGEKYRFLIIGAINTFFGIALYSLAYFLLGSTVGYIGSLITGYLVSSTIAFFLFRRYVFTNTKKNMGVSAYLRFHTVYLLPLSFNILALPALIEIGGLNPYFAQVVFSATWILYSYFGHSRFTFAAKK